jgi:hypothetical protein
LVPTALGPAARVGAYLYTVCLPLIGGGWSAEPGAALDEQAAERRFIAYAWPAAGGPFSRVYFIDEHDSIRVSPAAAPGVSSGAPPRCDPAASSAWPAWKDKKPREALPGDREAPPAAAR